MSCASCEHAVLAANTPCCLRGLEEEPPWSLSPRTGAQLGLRHAHLPTGTTPVGHVEVGFVWFLVAPPPSTAAAASGDHWSPFLPPASLELLSSHRTEFWALFSAGPSGHTAHIWFCWATPQSLCLTQKKNNKKLDIDFFFILIPWSPTAKFQIQYWLIPIYVVVVELTLYG